MLRGWNLICVLANAEDSRIGGTADRDETSEHDRRRFIWQLRHNENEQRPLAGTSVDCSGFHVVVAASEQPAVHGATELDAR